MAIVQTAAQLQVMAVKVGIPKERATDIKVIGDAVPVTNVAGLRSVVRRIGYYTEKADHLVAAGVTFA